MITGPTYHHNKVKFIQLSKVNEESLLAVIVVEGNMVKNQIINLDGAIDDEQISQVESASEHTLNGLTVDEINLGYDYQAEREGRGSQRRCGKSAG